jgi:DNA-binding protein YbaB
MVPPREGSGADTVTAMTGSMFAGASPEETGRRVEEWAEQFAAKAERYQWMQAQVAQVSSTEASPDGAVRVTVDSSGVVTDLVLSDRALQLRPQQLSTQILDVMRRAQSRLTGQVAQVMQQTVGEDRATVQSVVASYEQRFPEPPPEAGPEGYGGDLRLGELEDDTPPPRPTPPPQRRPRRTDEDDDGWDDRPLMR